MLGNTLLVQTAFSLLVIVAFGYRQFNQWTDAETRNETSDVELLAFAPPRSFTSLWRFVTVAAMYCSALVILYYLLLAFFRSPPEAGMNFLKVGGVTPENAWLVALFVVTGLSPILPVFSNVERNIREVMHAWAVVPSKAQQMAEELASPSATFEIDETFYTTRLKGRLGPAFTRGDLTSANAITVAQKWCRLKYLVAKYAPPVLDGEDASGLRSPYTTRFRNDFMALQEEVLEFARTNADQLRTPGGSPAVVSLLDRIDAMLHRLYVLMCCRAFSSERSLEDVVDYFRRSYGIGVRNIELTLFPTDPIFDTLCFVTAAVFGVSFTYTSIVGDDSVHPVVWAVSAFATHGLGFLVGWFIFSRRRRHYRADILARNLEHVPLSRKLLLTAVVLGFALASAPTWLTTLLQLMQASANRALPFGDLASRAFQQSWPWAFLGSATAIAVYSHLERSSNRESSIRLRISSALGHALMNIVISLLILGLYAPPSDPGRTLVTALEKPVYQLVLLLTGTIGLVLGFYLPRVVHGHGVDLRGGALRYRPSGEAAAAIFTFGGRQIKVTVHEISLTGCVLRLPNAEWLTTGRYGTLLLNDGTNVFAHFVRDAKEYTRGEPETDDNFYAMQFSAPQQLSDLSRLLRQRLTAFLEGLRPEEPAAEPAARAAA